MGSHIRDFFSFNGKHDEESLLDITNSLRVLLCQKKLADNMDVHENGFCNTTSRGSSVSSEEVPLEVYETQREALESRPPLMKNAPKPFFSGTPCLHSPFDVDLTFFCVDNVQEYAIKCSPSQVQVPSERVAHR